MSIDRCWLAVIAAGAGYWSALEPTWSRTMDVLEEYVSIAKARA